MLVIDSSFIVLQVINEREIAFLSYSERNSSLLLLSFGAPPIHRCVLFEICCSIRFSRR
jgi:hypothetical protein